MGKVHASALDSATFNSWSVVLTRTEGGRDSLTVIKMVPKSEMFRAGLEQNHKVLVDMERITESLATLVEALVNIDKMNEENWNKAFEAFKPFISQRMKFQTVKDFIDNKTANEWE